MYLGIDGGGTWTKFALVRESGELLAEHESSGSYYLDVGLEGVRDVFEAGVENMLSAAGATLDDVNYAFIGIPAYGEDSRLLGELDALPARLFPRGNYRCDNDMVCAWAGSLACQDGINLIAGTGSIGFGRYGDRTARCGGWGEVFGDEGSAYWVARRGLQLFSKMSDGRAARGPLHDLVRRKYGLAQDLDMSTLVAEGWNRNRARIADFSRLMATAARAGDDQVARVFVAAADELVEMVESIRLQLGAPQDADIKVSCSGGVFEAGDVITAPLALGLGRRNPRYRLTPPVFSPAIGAAYYAAVLDGCERIRDALAGSCVTLAVGRSAAK